MIIRKDHSLFIKNIHGAEILLGSDTNPEVIHWAKKRMEEKITTPELFEILGLKSEKDFSTYEATLANWQIEGERLLLEATFIGNQFQSMLDYHQGSIKPHAARLLSKAIRILQPLPCTTLSNLNRGADST